MIFKRNTTRALAAFTASSIFAAFACTGATAQTNGAAATLAPGQFKVGMEITYPPFESYDGDKVVGSDPDLSRALAKQLGANPSFVDTRFSGLILGLNARHYDAIISGMYVTPERVAQAQAIPYAQTGAAIMVPTASPLKPKSAEDLCGLRVGLEQGTTWVAQLQSLSTSYCKANGKGPIVVSEYPSAPEVLQALLSNNVQAQMEISGAAHALSAKSSGRVVVSSTQLIYPQTLGIYVRKDNKPLFDALTRALDALKKNGEYDAVLKKYDLAPPPAAKAS
ncbi:ABC transporter substrate-binding protein [Paraburkholderia megapolitana]|uniref:Polar amino acid transport system substrate-binding protein n=1 Tax=Paraburkholderia megapolitana TaxID=420953 RepID=A0A1I3MUW4_9BURK|nr:ABC transporter substrate-binding protein [Paraburkholderia megapolitana]QDQ84144.1 ABC transporter substrate-binding protein [Paraburkholderia megapolitana]SFJ00731.1 polar amino acid transport system substrate-binding protein [Paraburkholderia megapolitana]